VAVSKELASRIAKVEQILSQSKLSAGLSEVM
jgi:hypothetical protein